MKYEVKMTYTTFVTLNVDAENECDAYIKASARANDEGDVEMNEMLLSNLVEVKREITNVKL